MADPRDYYESLGVARDADEKAIKDAFRQLALKYHSDRNKAPDATERFKEMAKAYAVLSDPKKRVEYNAGGRAGIAGFSAVDLFGGIDFGAIFGGFGSLFWGGGAVRTQVPSPRGAGGRRKHRSRPRNTARANSAWRRGDGRVSACSGSRHAQIAAAEAPSSIRRARNVE